VCRSNMANKEHLEIIRLGGGVWNEWRKQNPLVKPDLSHADLTQIQIGSDYLPDIADLTDANLEKANLSNIDLDQVTFRNAKLREADLRSANLFAADLSGANLNKAILTDARLDSANLANATLIGAQLDGANLARAELDGADFNQAILAFTNLSEVDLSNVKGLEATDHYGPSDVSVGTLYKSEGNIPESFLRDCGLPEDFLTFLPSLIGVGGGLNYYSCFISYSHKDEAFARKLYASLRDIHIRTWFALENMKGGEKLHEQIGRAIEIHDRLLIILSRYSLQSDWVRTEIRKARKVELAEKRRKLFPIRLVNMKTIQEWECFDADRGTDLATEIREYFIPDFSHWREPDAFRTAFDRLVSDLRAEERATTV
jgi:hypothetical protein